MLNVADFLVSGFVFFLFVSICRKRGATAVRYWTAGWFCIVLHFGANLWRAGTELSSCLRSFAVLATLVLCGISFLLSYALGKHKGQRQKWIGALAGTPWVATMVFAALPGAWFRWVEGCAVLSHICAVPALYLLVGTRSKRFVSGVLLTLGSAAWLLWGLNAGTEAGAVGSVLTLCFGCTAVLLGAQKPRGSAASLTMSFGTVSWTLVWIGAAAAEHYAPSHLISPEIWNLPKYLVAAGMVLRLLDEEIRAQELASEQYRLLFAANPHAMWIYDPRTLDILEANDAAVSQYGYSKTEFGALRLVDIVQTEEQDSLEELRTAMPQTLSGPWLHRRKDGSEFQVEIASQPVERNGARATFALMHDVTEPQRLHAQLIRQAHHDVLTGLPNRAYFEDALERVLEEAELRFSKAALFCIDLDRFKQINDTYGHAAGDLCLCELANRFNDRLQGAGVLARTGGDEFMLVIGDLDKAEMAEHLATLLLYDLKDSLRLESGEVELIASIGIAVYPDDGQHAVALWRDADAAMYRAKRAGGSQWVRVSREISRIAAEANEIEQSLRRALKAGDLTLSYQPQITAAGELHCLEALVRFNDPLLAHAPAGRVIALAEESGLIVPLGEWVLEEVCRQSREWIDSGLQPVQIALNVSPLQLTRLNFSVKVATTLERYHLVPQLLEFEVTESTVMPDRGTAPEQIAMLARMGIRFSVDDFGTGYSSLGRLHQLPVEALKIDSSFVRSIAERKGTYPTVRAIIALAHTFGLQVVAEGVETEEQLRILRTLQCDRMQGYLFSKPLPAEQVMQFLGTAVYPAEEVPQGV